MLIISMTAGLPGPRSRLVSPPHAVAGHRFAALLGKEVLHLRAYNGSCFCNHAESRFSAARNLVFAHVNRNSQALHQLKVGR